MPVDIKKIRRTTFVNEIVELLQDGQDVEVKNAHISTFTVYVKIAYSGLNLIIEKDKLNEGYSVVKIVPK